MKNKLQSLKSRLKKLKFIHILLIILILVVFFGLFKKEIASWSVQNLPTVKNRTVEVQNPCKQSEENPQWKNEYDQLSEKCFNPSNNNPTKAEEWSFIGCLNKVKNEIKVSRSILVDSYCKGYINEKWLWAFSRYWFKVK